jgi:hypothetical protein
MRSDTEAQRRWIPTARRALPFSERVPQNCTVLSTKASRVENVRFPVRHKPVEYLNHFLIPCDLHRFALHIAVWHIFEITMAL